MYQIPAWMALFWWVVNASLAISLVKHAANKIFALNALTILVHNKMVLVLLVEQISILLKMDAQVIYQLFLNLWYLECPTSYD